MNESLGAVSQNSIELKIEISAPQKRVWEALIEEIDQWWPADFRMLGKESKVIFDTQPAGGGLLESTPSGDWLIWFEIQMYQPTAFQVYLVGHVAPDWGGPAVSHLKIAIYEGDEGKSVFALVDARYGNVSEDDAANCHKSWTLLFSDGLKQYVEA